jgi:tape measure domain-containing protein
MAGGVEFSFSLIDKASGPANRAAGGIDRARAALHNLDRASRPVGILGDKSLEASSAMDKMGGSARGAGRRIPILGRAIEAFRLEPVTASLAVATALGGIGIAAAAAAVRVAQAVAGIAMSLGRAVAGAFELREKAQLSFEALRKAGGSGEAQFNRVKQIAKEFGTDLGDTVHQFQEMAAAQFTMEESIVMFKRMQDLLKATGASADVAGRAMLQITQIKAKGRLMGEELTVLQEAGLSTELVFKALAKNMKKPVGEIQKLISAGKVDAVTAIKSIQDAIGMKTGDKAPGMKALEILNKTLSGTVERIKNFGGILLDDIVQVAGPAIAGLKPIFDEAFAALSGEQGKAVMKEIGLAIAGIGKAVISAWPFVKTFLAGFAQGLGEGWKQLKEAGGLIKGAFGEVDVAATLKEWGPEIRETGAGLAKMLFGFALLASAITGVVVAGAAFGVWIAGIPFRLADAGVALLASGTELGRNIVTGIRNGITAGLTMVTDAVRNVANSALSAAKAALGIASPSKEFQFLGKMTAFGMARGVNDNAFAPQQAVTNMVTMPQPPAVAPILPTIAPVSGARSGGPSISIGEIHVHVTGGANPEQTAKEVAGAIRSEVESVLEQLAREVAA